MERIRIDNFNAGIIEAQEPDRIPDNALVDVVNLEYNNSNVLTARQTIAVYALSGWLESQGITTTQALSPGAGVAGVINATTAVTEYRINGNNALTISNGTIAG